MYFNEYFIFLLPFLPLLVVSHNYLFKQYIQSEEINVVSLSPRDTAIIYLVLLVGTLGLMFTFSDFSVLINHYSPLLAIGVTFVTSFFLISIFYSLLAGMRQKLPYTFSFLLKQDFLLAICLIIFTELSFLNWIIEVIYDFQQPIDNFSISYSVLLFIVTLLILNFSSTAINIRLMFLTAIDISILIVLSLIVLPIMIKLIKYFGLMTLGV